MMTEDKVMKTALIVWGGWSGHEPEQCAAIVKDMLEQEGFSVRVLSNQVAAVDPERGKAALAELAAAGATVV